MAYDGTLTSGTAAFAAGKFGNAKTTGIYSIGIPETGTTWTVEAWIKTTSAGAPIMAVAHEGFWYLALDGGRVRAAYGSGYAVSVYAGTSGTLNDNAFHHIALVLNNGVGTAYVDGVRGDVGASQASPTGSTAQTTIGGLSNGGFAFPGSIDEVRISNVARYTGATYTVPAAEFTPDANTVALYHLESDASNAVTGGGGDTTAPTVPSGLTAIPGNAQAALSWSPSTDATGVTGYRVYRGGTLIASPTTTSYTDTGRTNGTAYSYTVSAFDAAGNESAQSSAVSATPTSAVTIAANDPGIAYSPYNWDVTSARAGTINPGAYFFATLTGATGITLAFDMTGVSAPVPRVKARVDGGSWTTYDLASTIPLTLPADNVWTTHHVEVVVASTSEFLNRWNPQNATVKLTGIVCTGTSVTARTPVKSGLNVLVFGDSITEGYKTLKDVQTPDGSDAEVTWSYRQRDELGAEVGVVGFGAQGWLNGGQGGVPALPTSYNLLWSGVSRSFTPAPDVIVVNMGHNDSGDIVSAATTFLNNLLALNSTTKIALMRPYSGNQAANLQAARAACSAPSRVTYIDTTGWWTNTDAYDGVHPWGLSSLTSLAARLANALRTAGLIGGSSGFTPRRFIIKNGSPVPIG